MIALVVSRARVDIDKIAGYVERCQTPDGGFCFACVPPGGAMDTYHALMALRLLGRRPARVRAARQWVETTAAKLLPGHPRTVFHLTQAGRLLGVPRATRRRWAAGLGQWRNEKGGFGGWRDVYVEAPSELETTYFAVLAEADLGLGTRRDAVTRFVLSLQNTDGGFGGNGRSALASTSFAVSILARAGHGQHELAPAGE